jgi:twinfilin-like protein
MLYASTRGSLLKSLGSTLFTDSIFATSRSDLTPEAYAAHRKHLAAPQPLSAHEQELADIRAAERDGGGSGYDGSRTRQNHVGTGVGLSWSGEVEQAVAKLGESEGSEVIVVVSACLEMRRRLLFLNTAVERRKSIPNPRL